MVRRDVDLRILMISKKINSIPVLRDIEYEQDLVGLYKNKCFENSTAPISQVIQALKGERRILNLNVSKNGYL